MKEFTLGLTFLFILALYPLSWWIDSLYHLSASTTIRQLRDLDAIDPEVITQALRLSTDSHFDNALARRLLPEKGFPWRWIGLPAVIFLVLNSVIIFKAACEERRQNKSGEGTA